MGTHSPLSGFVDRRTFLELTELELKRCRRYHHFVSLLLLDLQALWSYQSDLPKAQWIYHVARLIHERVRDADILGAFQSGVIGILLPHSTREEAFRVGNRLADWTLECLVPAAAHAATVRIGVAVYPSRAVTVEDLFCEAIQALCNHSSPTTATPE